MKSAKEILNALGMYFEHTYDLKLAINEKRREKKTYSYLDCAEELLKELQIKKFNS